MFSEAALALTNWKILGTVAVMILTILADAFTNPGSIESWTSKAILGAAVAYLIRELRQKEKESKEDRERCGDEHQKRDTRMEELFHKNTQALEGLKQETSLQTRHFESFGRKLMERGIGEDKK